MFDPPLQWLDHSEDTPAANLALDEALLDAVANGDLPDVLRFWECPAPFVVLGTSQVLHAEANAEACAADGVPILRRCSAGGCVLQGPGSLNYVLALRLAGRPGLHGIRRSYRALLAPLAEALAQHGVAVAPIGISDLARDGRKVSGNAQRRARNTLLHHGTLLYRADTAAMARYLREPAERPAYRGTRAHGAFVTALPLDAATLRATVRQTYNAAAQPIALPAGVAARAAELAAGKYCDPAWTQRR